MKKIVILHLLVIAYSFGKRSAELNMEQMEEEMGHNDPAITSIKETLPNGSLQIENLTNIENVLSTATTKDVTIYFYSSSNPDEPISINSSDIKSLATKTKFDTSKESLFIIHGWRSSYNTSVNTLIKKAVLRKYDVNVFVVDWSPLADKSYVTAFVNVPKIGEIIGYFLKNVSEVYQHPFDKMKLVGHSLGAHITGVAGKLIKGALPLIIGLDPAGPLFTKANAANRLSKSDAQYVQVIHTCGKLLGFYPPLGHSDYYPNGGLSQPGCDIDITGTCSHSRAYEYYAETISSDGFVATKCKSYYASYLVGSCKGNVQSNMGGYNPDTKAHGKFYLKTKSSSPYEEKN